MGIYAKGTFTGNYVPRGDIRQADCIIGCLYGSQPGAFWGLVNEASAAFIANQAASRYLPLLLAKNIARPLQAKFGGPVPALVFRDEASSLTTTDSQQGTKGELLQACEYMEANGLKSPALVGQAYHVGRIALQAERLDMQPIVPAGLPDIFDPGSAQPWTQGPAAWALREAVGVPILHLTHNF